MSNLNLILEVLHALDFETETIKNDEYETLINFKTITANEYYTIVLRSYSFDLVDGCFLLAHYTFRSDMTEIEKTARLANMFTRVCM